VYLALKVAIEKNINVNKKLTTKEKAKSGQKHSNA